MYDYKTIEQNGKNIGKKMKLLKPMFGILANQNIMY